MNYDRIIADLHVNQKPYRILHIFGVLQTCLALGQLYGGNLEKLTLAALLHDCAKHVGRDETLALANQGAIHLDEEDLQHPAIWHGAVGAYLARTTYGIDDEEVLSAVEHHTLGTDNPSTTLQILMISDYSEPTRYQPQGDDLREVIRKDLRKGLAVVLNRKIEDLILKDQKPHQRIYSTIRSMES